MTTKKRFRSEYNSWKSMLRRALDPNEQSYKYVGGKGYTVCDSWLSFETFLADMGPKPSPQHSIDRVNRFDGYHPLNCRWATLREQAANTANARILEFSGESLPISEWARRTGIAMTTISHRINRLGMTPEQALTIPAKRGNKYIVKNRCAAPLRMSVIFHKARQKWQAVLRVDGKPIYCGHHCSQESARVAMATKATELNLDPAGIEPA